jgi:hypothetical protein
MKEKTGFVTRLMEYGLLITTLHKGFLIVSGILYFTVVSGILTYTIAINEPMAIGKITLLSLLLILSIILTKLIPFRVHTLKSVETRRRKKALYSRVSDNSNLITGNLSITSLKLCYDMLFQDILDLEEIILTIGFSNILPHHKDLLL